MPGSAWSGEIALVNLPARGVGLMDRNPILASHGLGIGAPLPEPKAPPAHPVTRTIPVELEDRILEVPNC